MRKTLLFIVIALQTGYWYFASPQSILSDTLLHTSATVEETLSFAIVPVVADSGSYCGVVRSATSPDTTATAVPFGTVADAAGFINAQQQLTVSTNADRGYAVYAEEDDKFG